MSEVSINDQSIDDRGSNVYMNDSMESESTSARASRRQNELEFTPLKEKIDDQFFDD